MEGHIRSRHQRRMHNERAVQLVKSVLWQAAQRADDRLPAVWVHGRAGAGQSSGGWAVQLQMRGTQLLYVTRNAAERLPPSASPL